ncbi:heavy metal translocating P-type ATPase [Subdoligranulum variabile]|uniref:heavy metal translocating P-type ATPase n=1 Tax=Subdoligranulum variabile TaxID=214851 RepID=UPI0026F2132A|nr:heavy metal translocating P-type ATPase [Subdoligranulum variabile]
MQRYEITGMSCAACASHVEKAVAAVPGVQSVSVSLLTNSMQVQCEPGADEARLQKRICRAVEAAGYGAALADDAAEVNLDDTETPRLKKRLIFSLCFLVPLMYLSMGHMIGLPLPPFLEGAGPGALVYGLLQLALTLPVCWINRAFFISGWKGVRTKAPGMDTLVAMGAGAALLYGVFALIMISAGLAGGDEAMVLQYRHDLYFESAAMILTLITVGKTLEAYSKGRTTDALKSLMQLAPQTATVLRDGQPVTVPVSEVEVGDLFLVKPGESIPVDGTVAEGVSSVNEAALTGESMPVDKFPGSPVSAATINQNGSLTCRAERVGQDTTLSQVIRLVRDAAATKAPLAKTADKVSGIFVPAVIGIAAVTFLIWLLLGQTFAYALARGISVLVISCPCALGLATPVAIMVGSGVGAKHGILFKTAASLETTGYTDTVLLDKTGTITTGEPSVVKIVGTRRVPEKFLLSMAAGLELRSEHPLARAILQRAEHDKVKYTAVAGFEAVPGQGLRGKVAGKVIAGGNADFIRNYCVLPPDLEEAGQTMSAAGITPLYFSLAGSPAGVIGVSDVVKKTSAGAIAQMKALGLNVVLLTGDNEATARHIGELVGLDAKHVVAGVLPAGKEKEVRRWQARGRVAMVGDGINDAPALTRAETGIAIGAGADVALDAADVVLVRSDLADVPAAVRLSRAVVRNIHENLFWAFIYNIICIPLAAGVFTGLGITLNPMIAAAAMSLSSVCVVANALRLNTFDPRSADHDTPPKHKAPARQAAPARSTACPAACPVQAPKQEVKTMTRTIHIEGMMCAHCEATVKKALEALDGVENAAVSHESGTAVVSLSKEVADAALKDAVEAKDYTVTGIEG